MTGFYMRAALALNGLIKDQSFSQGAATVTSFCSRIRIRNV